ncbi:LptF/LptG family permease [Acanthopleuribacter pedis]|uniref:LptF/LptG family permease n=1 Tax=Acanthopleuribacter pedis TaxID=442870 RepID=A0A8J7Q8C3_9BACT|nr:LptF/LptG family permease [Acanthopleuribacter pedis]MBO1318739.1 LptF/LptG family permease [Acanthopleuribacter pedis]
MPKQSLTPAAVSEKHEKPCQPRTGLFPLWSRLDSYIFGEINRPFMMAMLVYNGIFFIKTLAAVAELSGGKFEIPYSLLILFFVSEIPEFLFITITMSFLFAALAGMGRLSTDSEILAPQVVGVSFWRLSRPVFVYGGLLTLFLLVIANWIGPMLNRVWLNESRNFSEIAMPNIQPGVINPLGKSMLYVDRVEEDRLADLIFVDVSEEKEEILIAEHASIYENRDLDLFRAVKIDLLKDQTMKTYATTEMTLSLPMPAALDGLGLKGAPRDLLDTPRLKRYLAQQTDPKRKRDLEIELYQRLFNPLICLVFALYAVPLGAKHARIRKGSGFGTSLVLIGFYFIVSKIARDAASQDKIHLLVGMAGPTLVFLAGGVILQVGKNRWWSQPLRRLQDRILYVMYKPINKLFNTLKKKKTQDAPQGGAAQTFIFPSRLDIYVTRSFLSIFFLVQCSLLVLALLVEYTQVGKYVTRNQIAPDVVLRYLGFKLPEMLDLTFFLCLLISTLILFAVMSKYQEVTAVRAAGGSLQRLCLPLVFCGLGASIFNFYISNTFLPYANRRATVLRNEIRQKSESTFSQDVWLKTAPGEIVNFQVYDHRTKRLLGVRRFRIGKDQPAMVERTELPQVVFRNNQWKAAVPGKRWAFHRDSPDQAMKPTVSAIAENDPVSLNIKHEDLMRKRRKPSEFSLKELRGYIRYVRELGYVEPSFQTELNVKFAQPLVPLIMMMLAMPLGFQFGRRGTFFGVGIGLVAGLLFLGLFEALRQMGGSGLVHPIVAGWSVVVLFGFFSLYRFVNLE